MLARAEPIARFMLVCSRLARAARTAAAVSGARMSMAMAIPIRLFGAPAASTPRSMAGERTFASPTTATREIRSSVKLSHV